MKKVKDFIKSNVNIVKWTMWYFFVLWLILRFVFHFDMFSSYHWWKFFHATLHGFGGLVFGLLIYTAVPIYIATTLIIYRTKELVITIPYLDKVIEFIRGKKATPEPEPTIETEPEKVPEYPDDLPHELRVPYMRAKNRLSFMGNVSVYNKQAKSEPEQKPTEDIATAMPIPSDFDISESLDTNEFSGMPNFTDISFDEPETKEENLENNTTKYFTEKNIEFETYKQFVATEKYIIYEHNDDDFWIMDNDTWFASGKQIDSPVNDLIQLGKQNGLIPVLYLQSQNIMDIETTINKLEDIGIRVIKSLDELD